MGKQVKMQYAIDTTGKSIHINDVIDKQSEFFCYFCHKPVRVRNTKFGVNIFYHYNPQKKKVHNFTEHREIQKYIVTYFLGKGVHAECEVALSSEIRADVIVYHKRLSIFEVQRTSISLVQMQKRMNFYATMHLQLIWLFIFDFKGNGVQMLQVSKWELFAIQNNCHVLYLDVKKKRFYSLEYCVRVSSTRALCSFREITLADYISETTVVKNGPQKKLVSQKFLQYFSKMGIRWYKRHCNARHTADPLWILLYTAQARLPATYPSIFTPITEFIIFSKNIYWMQLYLQQLIHLQNQRTYILVELCQKEHLFRTEHKQIAFIAITKYVLWLKKSQRMR